MQTRCRGSRNSFQNPGGTVMISQEQETKYIPNDEFCHTVEQMLEEGMDVEFTVTGNSMWPLLKHGRDKVTLTPCKYSDIKKGDVILFEALPSKYLLHRVTRISEKHIETTGDFNTFRDGKFPKTCVKCKAINITRKGKCYKTDAFFMKLYSFCWMKFFAVRKPLLKFIRFISKTKHTP